MVADVTLAAVALGFILGCGAMLLGAQVGYRLAQRVPPAGAIADTAQAIAAAPVVAAQTLLPRPAPAVTVTDESEWNEEHGRKVAEALQARAAQELGTLTATDAQVAEELPVGE